MSCMHIAKDSGFKHQTKCAKKNTVKQCVNINQKRNKIREKKSRL